MLNWMVCRWIVSFYCLTELLMHWLWPLRWHGYRSDNRYLVFQCLQHTVGFSNAQWRVLDKCHKKRNLAEYEGLLDIDKTLLKELMSLTQELYDKVSQLKNNAN